MDDEVEFEELSPAKDRLTKKKRLLKFAADKCGLPISHISELQNGAGFCFILSSLCSSYDLDVSNVNFLATEPREVLENYRLVQAAAATGSIDGLNHDAKLRHWIRLSESETDAWKFLALLRKCFIKAGMRRYSIEIEPDATPPPPPVLSRKARKRQSSPLHSGSDSTDSSPFQRLESLARESSLTSSTFGMPSFLPPGWGREAQSVASYHSLHSAEYEEAMADYCHPGSPTASPALPTPSASTQRAYSFLKQILEPAGGQEEQPSRVELESPVSSRKWSIDSAEDRQDTLHGSEDGGSKVSYESSYEDSAAGLRDIARAFSDDSSYYYGCLSGTKGPNIHSTCVKNGKVYEDPLDFVFE